MSSTFACRRLAAGVLAIAWIATPAMALAADKPAAAASGGLDEIVVTATRREERLQDVPISISAYSQEKLDAQSLRTIDDLSRLSPGVTFARNGFSSTGNYNDEGSDINIRGVDSAAGTSTTGIYIDDTPIQTRHVGFGSINAFPQLFDLDRVEVLRGPQGTLFGAGAEGGAVRFIAPEPNLTGSSGYYRAEVGSTRGGDPSYEGGAAAGGALVDGVLGFRVSASYRRDGGWVDRVGYNAPADNSLPSCPATGCPTRYKAVNWQETATFRAALKWKVTDTLTVSPSIYYQHLQLNDTSAYWPDLSRPDSDVYRSGNRNANVSTDPFWIAAVKLDWDLGSAQLTSNTAYYRRDQHGVSDYSQYLRATYAYFAWLPNTYPPPGTSGIAQFRDVQRNYYEEIRLASTDKASRLSWTAGVFFSHLSENVPEFIIDPTLANEISTFTGGAVQFCATFPCPTGLIDNLPEQRFTDKQVAVFGEIAWKFTDTLKATLGLRYSKLDYTLSTFQNGAFVGATIDTSGQVGGPYTKATTGSDKPVTPKLVLAWQPDRDNLYYASASKGFRPGTINFDVGNLCQFDLNNLGLTTNPATATSDSLWSYELGGKNTFLDRRLQVNTSVFYIDWKNIQQNVYLPTCGEQFAANLGQATIQGGDISISLRPIEALTIDFAAAYTDAKLTKTACAGALTLSGTVCTGTPSGVPAAPVVTKGDRLVGAPWTFTAAAEYHFGEWQGRRPYVRIDYVHTSAQTSNLTIQNPLNAVHDPTLPGLPITNNIALRGGLRFSGLDVSLYVLNLTDAHPISFRARDLYPDITPVSVNDHLYFERGVRPRQIGVTATYRY